MVVIDSWRDVPHPNSAENGVITQVVVRPDTVKEDVADALGRNWRTAAVIGPDPSAHVSLTRNTVAEEVALALEYAGCESSRMEVEVAHTLQAVGLAEHASAAPWELSGGQTRRLILATVGIAKPAILVVCDPTTGLDSSAAQIAATYLRSLRKTAVVTVAYAEDPALATEPGDEVIYECGAANVDRPAGDLNARVVPEGPAQSVGPLTARRGDDFEVGPVTLPVQRGGVVWLCGANGSGKSTLLRAMAGLDDAPRPKDWDVHLALQNPEDQLIESRCAQVATESPLQRLGIDPDEHPLDLSESNRKLLQVAAQLDRAESQQRAGGTDVSQLVLLDEPEAGLAPAHYHVMLDAIARALCAGVAIVMACHRREFALQVEEFARLTSVDIGEI